eukprot:ctg_411.g209
MSLLWDRLKRLTPLSRRGVRVQSRWAEAFPEQAAAAESTTGASEGSRGGHAVAGAAKQPRPLPMTRAECQLVDGGDGEAVNGEVKGTPALQQENGAAVPDTPEKIESATPSGIAVPVQTPASPRGRSTPSRRAAATAAAPPTSPPRRWLCGLCSSRWSTLRISTV